MIFCPFKGFGEKFAYKVHHKILLFIQNYPDQLFKEIKRLISGEKYYSLSSSLTAEKNYEKVQFIYITEYILVKIIFLYHDQETFVNHLLFMKF